mgnify:CR=1 FL=1
MLDTAAAGLVLTGEDKEIVDMVHDFVLKEVRPKAAEHDISGELDWDAYNKAFEMGLVCADLPAEYGGQGLSNVSAAWIREELMYGDAGFGLTCGTNNLGIKPVLIAGTEEQKKWQLISRTDSSMTSVFHVRYPTLLYCANTVCHLLQKAVLLYHTNLLIQMRRFRKERRLFPFLVEN